MKFKLFLLFCISGIVCTDYCVAQQVSQGEYKSWSEFKPDTTAYLNYNWSRASKYRVNERNVPLKTFLDDLELPITAVTFKIYNHLIVGAIIHVEPYELLVRTPIKKRIGFTLVFSPHYLLAAPYEEKIPELANRDKTKLEYVSVKWNDEYTKEIENLKYEYILYSN